MQIYSKTDKGKVRNTNQDAFFAAELEQNAAFAIVCDGMGGANAGNIASETAIKIISEYIIRSYRLSMDGYEIERMLKNALESANIDIYDMAQKNKELSGMGTTAVVALYQPDVTVIAHVGDSRAYLADKQSGTLKQLTRDHSVVQSLIESGKITPEDAKVHPKKNVITRALGAEENVVVDRMEINLNSGQTLLLCTDGLSGYVDEGDILDAFAKTDIANLPDRLVELANENGGGDNITVVTLMA